jgi:hypothetical protein
MKINQISKVLGEIRTETHRFLYFRCPGCAKTGHGLHQVMIEGGNSNWGWNGNIEKPTFSPSVLVTYRHPKGYSNDNPAPVGWKGEYVDDRCHSFVTDGRIQFLGDCTHSLANQTMDLPDLFSEDSSDFIA